jgi:hypothetical protein
MPRTMPPLAADFAQRIVDALSVARAGDLAATSTSDALVRGQWHVARVELLYELAFLRIFSEWEVFLEQTFLRYLCGYQSTTGVGYAVSQGQHCTTLQIAQNLVLGTRQYVLWHNPVAVTSRARRFLVGCPHETVVASHTSRLERISAVRHRVVHGQDDARVNFDQATTSLCGRRYRGSRPGRFLRDWDSSVAPPRRWLETLGAELEGLAQQIC